MEHKGKQVLVGLALTIGLVAGGTATVAVASPTEVLGQGSEAGGLVIPDSGAGTSGSVAPRACSGVTAGAGASGSGASAAATSGRTTSARSAATARPRSGRSRGRSRCPGGRYAYAITPKKFSGNQAYYHNC